MSRPEAHASRHEFVVAAFEASPFLGDCLRSLRSQTYPSAVTVSTSTPCAHIARIARDFDAEVKVGNCGGIADDWNCALSTASREFVTIAHQDDVYDPDFAAATLQLFDRHPTGLISFTGCREIDDAGRLRSSRISRVKRGLHMSILGREPLVSPARLRLFLSLGNPLPCPSVTFRAELLRTFRFEADFQSNLDWEAWVRLSQEKVEFLQTPRPLVRRRHNPLTATSRLIREGVRQAEDREMFSPSPPPSRRSTVRAMPDEPGGPPFPLRPRRERGDGG